MEIKTSNMPDTKTVISLNKPTPYWATIAFRVIIVLTSAVAIWVAATTLISNGSKVEILLALKTLDFVAWGIGKVLGVAPADEQPNQS